MSLYRTKIQSLFAKIYFDTFRRIHAMVLLSLYLGKVGTLTYFYLWQGRV